MARFQISFSGTERERPAQLYREEECIPVKFDAIHRVTEPAEPYLGPYEVIPQVEAQVLPTKQRMMQKDLTVKQIPFFETSNSAGGTTVYIAAEIEEEV